MHMNVGFIPLLIQIHTWAWCYVITS